MSTFRSIKINSKQGIIKWVVLIIFTVLLLSFFNFDIQSFIEKPQTQKNINYVRGVGIEIWDKYLSKPSIYIWNNLFSGFALNAFNQLRSQGGLIPADLIPLDSVNSLNLNLPTADFRPFPVEVPDIKNIKNNNLN